MRRNAWNFVQKNPATGFFFFSQDFFDSLFCLSFVRPDQTALKRKRKDMRKNRTLCLAAGCILSITAGFLITGWKEQADGREERTEAETVFEGMEIPAEGERFRGDAADGGLKMTGGEEEGGRQTEEMDWITLEETLRPSILQITCGGYTGSGVVWDVTEEEVIVAGSGHLLKNAEACEVICYAGVYYEASVERILEDCDIGFAVFPAEQLKEDGVKLRAVVPCGRGKEELIQGEELAVYGSMDHAAGNFVKGYLIEKDFRMQIEGYESEQELLLGGVVREGTQETGSGTDLVAQEGAAPVDAGMSGSGIFDRQGELVGILAGGDGKLHFAAVPVWRIRR